jgi:hypothetical protein
MTSVSAHSSDSISSSKSLEEGIFEELEHKIISGVLHQAGRMMQQVGLQAAIDEDSVEDMLSSKPERP